MSRSIPIYPSTLKKGDTIGVIAPSSYRDTSKLTPSVDYLTEQGFKVVFHPQTELKNGQLAGTEEQRVAALHDYFKDDNISAIFCTCGGNGAIHILDKIDYELIKQNPKIFMGFSDITLLLNAISAKTGLVTFHGPTMISIGKIDAQWRNQMISMLTGQSAEINITTDQDIEGTLYGGNLSVMQALIGTPYAPDMNKAVLMLEDINDHLSRYDRMIGHMKQAGWLNSLSALLLGGFINSQDNPERPFGFTIKQIAANQLKNTPLITNIPVSHGVQLCTLPIGANITLKNNKLSFKQLI